MFNKLICLLIRGITETLKCLNFLIFALALLGVRYSGKNDFCLIAISGFVIYLLATYATTSINKNNKSKAVKFLISIIIEFAVGFIIIMAIHWEYKIYCLIYFAGIIAYSQIHYDNECDMVISFIKKYVIVAFFLTLGLFMLRGTWYKEVIDIYIPMYLIMSIVYIIQVNILQEYKDVSANLINENRNIRRFSFMSLSVTILSILIFTTDFFKKIYEVAADIIANINYLVFKSISPLFLWIYGNVFSKTARYKPPKLQDGKVGQQVSDDVMKNEELMQQTLDKYYSKEHIVTKIIVVSVLIITVLIILILVYRRFMDIEISKNVEAVLDGEERSFVFKKGSREKKNKEYVGENIRNLHVIRRLYIDIVKILRNRGVEYKSYYTPNEYSSFIENTSFKDKGISELIRMYNDLRYGNRTISKEQINKAHKIKENL